MNTTKNVYFNTGDSAMSGLYAKDSKIFLSLHIVISQFIAIKLVYSSILLLLMGQSIELKLYGAMRG